jgi:hypothetical protein
VPIVINLGVNACPGTYGTAPLQGMIAPPSYGTVGKVTREGTTEGHRPAVAFLGSSSWWSIGGALLIGEILVGEAEMEG